MFALFIDRGQLRRKMLAVIGFTSPPVVLKIPVSLAINSNNASDCFILQR
jgi:hypothetical protein